CDRQGGRRRSDVLSRLHRLDVSAESRQLGYGVPGTSRTKIKWGSRSVSEFFWPRRPRSGNAGFQRITDAGVEHDEQRICDESHSLGKQRFYGPAAVEANHGPVGDYRRSVSLDAEPVSDQG